MSNNDDYHHFVRTGKNGYDCYFRTLLALTIEKKINLNFDLSSICVVLDAAWIDKSVNMSIRWPLILQRKLYRTKLHCKFVNAIDGRRNSFVFYFYFSLFWVRHIRRNRYIEVNTIAEKWIFYHNKKHYARLDPLWRWNYIICASRWRFKFQYVYKRRTASPTFKLVNIEIRQCHQRKYNVIMVVPEAERTVKDEHVNSQKKKKNKFINIPKQKNVFCSSVVRFIRSGQARVTCSIGIGNIQFTHANRIE